MLSGSQLPPILISKTSRMTRIKHFQAKLELAHFRKYIIDFNIINQNQNHLLTAAEYKTNMKNKHSTWYMAPL